MNYFQDIYLEDSYVLAVVEQKDMISFQMEFVLLNSHPLFTKPEKNEMYCYRRGSINFIHPAQIIWKRKNLDFVSRDASGEFDLGNIDSFIEKDDRYYLEGDWGELEIVGGKVEIQMD